jgi:restriction system protein
MRVRPYDSIPSGLVKVLRLVAAALGAVKRAALPAPRSMQQEQAWSPQLLKQLEWRRFEQLCAACFEMEGYAVRVARTAADGVVDLHLRQPGSDQPSILVQCKAWDAYRVGIEPVRRLHAAMTASRIREGMLVSSGRFTPEAAQHAGGMAIRLVDVTAFLARLAALPAENSAALLALATQGDYLTPTCPSCSIKMVSRRSTRQGRRFWGCRNYPQCKQTLPAVG